MVRFFKSGSKSLEALDLMNYIHLIALFQKNQQTLPSTILGYQQNLQRFAKVPDQTHRLHLVYHNQDEAHLVTTKDKGSFRNYFSKLCTEEHHTTFLSKILIFKIFPSLLILESRTPNRMTSLVNVPLEIKSNVWPKISLLVFLANGANWIT